MIPNVKTGRSFRGAELYYLHDKRESGERLRLSGDRVAWTTTRNTAHDAAEDAVAEMIATARDQDQLKLMSGERLSGRPCEQPVMTISLSWHPSETPSKEEMSKAADGYLRHMGWNAHQAVYVAHNDTVHPHLHIVLNRIHPETGRVLDDAFSKNRSQEWAREYERAQGRVWCEERIGKDYTRASENERRSLPHDYAIDARDVQSRYAELEEAVRTLDLRERTHLAKHHQDEREAFFESRHAQFREARETACREVRSDYKPRWVEHFRDAGAARQTAERDSADLAKRVLHFAREGDFDAAWEAVADRNAVRRAVRDEISGQRRELRASQRGETRERQDEACAALYEERARAYEEIKARQKEERGELKELQAARAEGQPYDKERLVELVTEPVAERLADRGAGEAPHIRGSDGRGEANSAELRADDREIEALKDAPEVQERLAVEQETDAGKGATERLPKRDAAEGLGGGIGKIAEVLADALSAMFNPPTPRDIAMARALDKAREEAEPARAAAREAEDARKRYLMYEHEQSALETFDSYFAKNAERLRREDDERHEKDIERER